MASSGTYAVLDNNNLIGMFDQLYDGALNKLWSASIATPMDSNSETETYGWLGAAPSLAELKGEARPEEGFKQFTYALKNKEYARAISLRELDMRRDKINQLTARVGEMAQKAAEHWDSLTATAITNGTSATCYDGVAFFAATHAESGSNQSNLLTGSDYAALSDVTTAATPTVAEMANILPRVLSHFHTFTDDKGDPMNGGARSFTVLCGTVPIFAAVNGALTADYVTGSVSNPVKGFLGGGYQVNAVLTPRLSSVTDAIYCFVNDGVVKPFIHQTEVPLDAQMTDTNSDEYKKFRRFLFSIYTSRAVGYGRWQGALKATMS